MTNIRARPNQTAPHGDKIKELKTESISRENIYLLDCSLLKKILKVRQEK